MVAAAPPLNPLNIRCLPLEERAQVLGAGQWVLKPYLLETLGVAVREELARPDVESEQEKHTPPGAEGDGGGRAT